MGMLPCLLLCFGVVASAAAPYRGVSEGGGEPCQPDKLTVYKVVLHTFWSRDRFPKHYPDWRPPAQWTKVFGESIKKICFLRVEGFHLPFGIQLHNLQDPLFLYF